MAGVQRAAVTTGGSLHDLPQLIHRTQQSQTNSQTWQDDLLRGKLTHICRPGKQMYNISSKMAVAYHSIVDKTSKIKKNVIENS